MRPVLDRFLRYVRHDTQSREGTDRYPSTEGQLVLLRSIAEELRELGLSDVLLDQHGYVTATVPATSSRARVPTIGFIAHVDTSPEMSGANVEPVVHASWDGRDIRFPKNPDLVLRAADYPALAARIGDDIVTAAGDTLLGADNKAGVAVVNGGTYGSEPHMPFGGLKQSGNGWREAGTQAIDVYSDLKTVYINHDPTHV